jgi:hypothetical protein
VCKPFPVMRQRDAKPHPMHIPWSVAELAYSVYARRYGTSQSLSRLAERGGFAPSELDDYLPDWRERCSEVAALKKEIKQLQVKVAHLNGKLLWMEEMRRHAGLWRWLREVAPISILKAAKVDERRILGIVRHGSWNDVDDAVFAARECVANTDGDRHEP